ncbi:glycosyltransferase family 4 protein [Rossellomorea vietnamensis]|uniref:Glycosyltransferase family 4 protein n=1 Tax=Rossellomorea vietnamensis TaxID=218284 RepID=A0ACD4C2F6_9BACI|nr:glycosyltransferase family 4 protein [Rossellomorea vietnamensis]UXH42770.1 glycosyltransferase family 4 protein [Rossellomorea vietnamensis]
MVYSILFCATVDYHFKAFHLPYMKWFKEQGWEVHVAASGENELPYVDKKFTIPIQRSPFSLTNIKAYQDLKDIIEHHQYRLIHCHTPMGGVLARLAARGARKNGTKVIYTAHGFHFCEGAPIQNWMLYYPIEKMLSRYTDCLITINKEDYNLAKHRFDIPSIEHVQGVGVNTETFQPISEKDRAERKKSFGYQPDDFLLFFAAEFNQNKNQQMLIKALASIKEEVPNAKLLLAGEGTLQKTCKELAKRLEVEHMVRFLGFRKDIPEILPMCDVAVASSLREGLPVNIMEAMACGLPVVASLNRGHRELVKDHQNGWIVYPTDIDGFSNKLKLLAVSEDIRRQMGMTGRGMIESTFSVQRIVNEKSRVYQSYMKEKEVEKWAVH